jgi:hypothetical protein
VVGCCECGDEPSDSGATELVRWPLQTIRVDYLVAQEYRGPPGARSTGRRTCSELRAPHSSALEQLL